MPDASLFITEREATLADANLAIQALRIEKHGEVFTVYLDLNWRKSEVALVSVRDKTAPRTFKHLGRLVEFIEDRLPRVKSIQLSLGHPLLPEKEAAAPPPRKRARKSAPKVSAKAKRR